MKTILSLILIAVFSITGCTKDKPVDSKKYRHSEKITKDSQINSVGIENESDYDEENDKIVVMDFPDAVQRSIKTAYPAGKIDVVSMERENTTLLYIVELIDQGSEYTIDVTPEGEIVEITEVIEIARLPETVIRSLNKAYPGSFIHEAEKVEEKGQEIYEVIIIAGGNKIEVTLDTAGKVLSEAKHSEEKRK